MRTRLALGAIALLLGGCADREHDHDHDDPAAGATALVVLLNPRPNDDHAIGVPDALGDQRAGVTVRANGRTDVTDARGVAVLPVSPGPVALSVGDASVDLEIEAEGDVLDVALAWDGDAAEVFDGTPVRYTTHQPHTELVSPGAGAQAVEALLEQDDLVVVLRPGVYEGDLTVRGSNVVLFGESYAPGAVVIDGSVDVRGGGVRVRGVTITGGLTSRGNDFGASFTTVRGPVDITGNAGAFLANTFCDGATVPSDHATLLDNEGVAPLVPASAVDCEDP